MVSYNEHKKIYEFYPVLIEYTLNGEDNRQFTNQPSTYDWLRSTYGVTKFEVSNVEPSIEQIKRLEDLNNLPNKEELKGFYVDVSNFIEYGYVDYRAPDIMQPLLEKHKDVATKYLFNKYTKLLSQYKKDKAYGSLNFKDMVIDTSLESQGTITGIFASFTAGLTNEVNFKAINGWFPLDKAKFMEMANAVSKHVSDSFTAELNAKKILADKNYEDLSLLSPSYLPKGVESSSVTPINRLLRLYEREYAKLATPDKVNDNVMEEPKIPGVFAGVDNDGKPLDASKQATSK